MSTGASLALLIVDQSMMKHISRKVKDKYEILGVIGEGAYGVVLKAREKASDNVVAIKHFKQAPGYNSDLDIIERELRILRSLTFENVVELIEWFRDKKRCFLVFEYVDSNMLQVLQQHPQGLPLDDVRRLSHQLFSAIHWCHTNGIIHRDIKPENLLISKDFVLKLCDFGFARFCNEHASTDRYTNYVATRWYRAPELLSGSAYGKPVDIWACGCIVAELATGKALFAGESDIDQLYRIQQSLGPLPTRYLEEMIRNPKFEGLKFPSVHHLDPLEPRFSHIFPAEMLRLFQNTLHLYAADRLTAEQCVQHEAFDHLNRKRSLPQPITAESTPSSQHDRHDAAVNHPAPSDENHLSKSHEENTTVYTRHRSPPIRNHVGVSSHTDLSFASSSFTEGPRHRSSNELTDRSASFNQHRPKIGRTRAKTYSSSTDEDEPMSMFTTRTSTDNIETNSNMLRKTYLQNYQSTSSIREPPIPAPSPFRYASSEALLRQKQPSLMNLMQASSKDVNKRLSLDQRQVAPTGQRQTSEAHIYRSSMIIVPEHNSNAFANRTSDFLSTSMPLEETLEEPTRDTHQQRSRNRENKRDLFRSKSVHFHPSVETTSNLQRTSSRQTLYESVPDVMDDIGKDSRGPTPSQGTRSFELESSNTYLRDSGERRYVYGSDSLLTHSGGNSLSFERPSFSPSKDDYSRNNKTVIAPQQDASASAKTFPKSILIVQPKTPNESSRAIREKQQSSHGIFGVYPLARNAMKHVANALMPAAPTRRTSSSVSERKTLQNEH